VKRRPKAFLLLNQPRHRMKDIPTATSFIAEGQKKARLN
jgi:hypothetical protein